MNKKNTHYYVAACVSIATLAIYLTALRNEFVIWDDPLYVVDNYHIRSLNWPFLKWAFLEYYASNWHPLTWISHALDYAVWGLNPMGHHLTNILLHAANTFLVVVLCMRLQEASQVRSPSVSAADGSLERRSLIAAGLAGLLFGIHPVHVESVAWVSERKDLLCGFFFLLSIMAYARDASVQGMGVVPAQTLLRRIIHKHYLLSLTFFLLALLSKPMAVTLPVVLLILDWHPFKRISSLKSFWSACIEKLPYFILSLIASYLTVMAQRSGHAMELMAYVPVWGRVFVATSSVISYLGNMVVPVGLSPFYPYPTPREVLTSYHLYAGLGVIVSLAIYVLLSKKRGFVLSALGYYGITLIPVIGVVQVGLQSMADRYTYLPSIGPFLLMGLAGAWFWEKAFMVKQWGRSIKLLTALSALAVVIFLFAATRGQIAVWKNSIDLWTCVLEKEPTKVVFAYINRGMAFMEKGQFDRALDDYSRAIALEPDNSLGYNHRGVLLGKMGQRERSLDDFARAIALNPAYATAHFNRGIVYGEMDQLDRAVEDYSAAMKLNPDLFAAYGNRGILFGKKGEYDRAIEDFTRAISLRPDVADGYISRGKAYKEKGLFDRALQDYTAAIALDPSSTDAYNNRGVVYKNLNQFDLALADYNKAVALAPSFFAAYCNRGLLHSKMGRNDMAIEDYTKALSLRSEIAQVYLDRARVYQAMGDSVLAKKDYQKACDLGDNAGCNAFRASRGAR